MEPPETMAQSATMGMTSDFSASMNSRRRRPRQNNRKTLPMTLHPTTVRKSSQVESILLTAPNLGSPPRRVQSAQSSRRPRIQDNTQQQTTQTQQRPGSRGSISDVPTIASRLKQRDTMMSTRPVSKFCSLLVNDEVELMEAISCQRSNNERSTKTAIEQSLSYLQKVLLELPIDSRTHTASGEALAVLRRALFDDTDTPTCFAAKYAKQRTVDQHAEIGDLAARNHSLLTDMETLQDQNTKLQSELEASRAACTEGEQREEKLHQYVHRLRQDLMSSFDDLKHMEANKDNAVSMVKHRTLELATAEQHLENALKTAQVLRHNLETAQGRIDDQMSHINELRCEAINLWAHIENPEMCERPRRKSKLLRHSFANAESPPP